MTIDCPCCGRTSVEDIRWILVDDEGDMFGCSLCCEELSAEDDEGEYKVYLRDDGEQRTEFQVDKDYDVDDFASTDDDGPDEDLIYEQYRDYLRGD